MNNKKSSVPKLRFPEFTDAWEQRKLGELLEYEQPTKYIVQSTDYDDSYITPVLTAGQSFILGFTNETTGIKNAAPEEPVIIFDDFTTSSHYVDFPFKVKSSAIKILKVSNDNLNSTFVFNLLKNIDYIPSNHERHWISIFSKFDVKVADNQEQQKIGSFFTALDRLITTHQRKLENVKKLKKSLLQKMFPKNGQEFPEIRFPEFTDAWEQRKLGELLEYEQPTKYIVQSTDYDDSYITPVLTAGQSFILGFTNETTGIKNAAPEEPVIIFDDFTTSSHYVDFPFKVKSSAIKILKVSNDNLNSTFVFNLLKNIDYIPSNHERHWISIFSKFDVKVADNQEQQKIGSFFTALDRLITTHQRKLENVKNLKKALLQQMFV
ncbi:restriction endonuclease subunit S [Pasteurella sp. PK-2025]|uniref:restriction endonuclease subunit S n=1 Tax=Pasteurella sp. PK-2025 TaxID=3413133 RepID=UPI003C75A673